MTLPVMPYRGGTPTVRQCMGIYAGGMGAGTNTNVGGNGVALIQPDGTTAQFDQLRGPTDIQYRGNNLTATSTITLSGWYRAA
jgi:hypothetical protein